MTVVWCETALVKERSTVRLCLPPDTAIAPRRLTTVLAALFLSTLFGAGLALILEYLDDSIKTTEEVENFLRLPALAAIPTMWKSGAITSATETTTESHSGPWKK